MQRIRELSFQNFYELLDENNKRKSGNTFWIEVDEAELCDIFVEEFKATFESFKKLNNYRLWKNEIYNFRLNFAAKKIQKQVKKKFIEPFMQLYKIIYSDVNKAE